MGIIKKHIILYLLITSVALSSCAVTEPEGPGEQIGKGIDLITKGLGSIENGESAASRLEKERLERLREEEIRNGNKNKDYNSAPDPYYGSQPDTYNDRDSAEDWSSDRRY